MSSAVAELDSILQSMLNLKPPGVSGSKITSITSLCTANIQSESVLIQKIYTHFKKTPGTHKLGVLYVVDSVTRQWVDQARKTGQQLGSGAPDGTFAAGVTRVTELLPVLMNDIIATAPEDQKVKIKKLVEIWERSNTFPTPLLTSIKEKLDAPRVSTTPEKSPAPGFVPLGQPAPNPASTAPPQQDTSAILEALKNMAKQNAAAQPAAPAQSSLNNLLGTQNGTAPSTSTVNPGLAPAPAAANGQAVNPLGALFAGLSNGAQNQSPANVPQNPLNAFLPQPQAPATVPQMPALLGQDPQAQFQILQHLAASGVPPEQWATAIQLINLQSANANIGGVPGLPFPPALPANNWAGQPPAGQSRDSHTRSPPNQYRRRSRSPGYDTGRRRDMSPRRRRDSPGPDQYRNDRDGRRGNDYRQRSPAGRRRRTSTPPTSDFKLPPPGPKNITLDHSLPKGHIKVYSRTLFVGGVTSSEAHLRSIFSKYGIVQTCIVNVDKRHAFVKMINRRDAESARTGLEEYKAGETQLRTKWGVGFGPRDCSDYTTGISVIPIERLTDADRKWLVTAEYGGTGGLPIEQYMVVEEPDIEIGAGVSSKAMSRRIATDQGGRRGPISSRQHSGRDDGHRDDDRRGDRNDRHSASSNTGGGGMAAMPFPMNFGNMPNGMPVFAGGFQFPQSQQQNKQD
ncbi:hypothetical protein A1O3_00509 [Capronia epimyces CBS 606.96]|uniref:Protein NRD1 n=1 Tax=Capronia epimyces CBS 606.96 TaxID=1182542 RepID=W9ZBS7_9EURO|nr:uncharacterized protein A1O3_00509 [Capronia epimyces CBS 606.96]EXJ91959.1 hypothetical protein A1O3_00509 [Capronia epimyces CBS 606.96]